MGFAHAPAGDEYELRYDMICRPQTWNTQVITLAICLSPVDAVCALCGCRAEAKRTSVIRAIVERVLRATESRR